MTFEGLYKPFNRVAMDTCASPIQQMSFETTMNFIVNASIHGTNDTLKSPSAQIVTGKLVSCGTGSFELLKALTVWNENKLLTKFCITKPNTEF